MSEKVKRKLRREYPLLVEMGWEPYDTESAARTVAEYAQEKIESLVKQLNEAKEMANNNRKYPWENE